MSQADGSRERHLDALILSVNGLSVLSDVGFSVFSIQEKTIMQLYDWQSFGESVDAILGMEFNRAMPSEDIQRAAETIGNRIGNRFGYPSSYELCARIMELATHNTAPIMGLRWAGY